MGSILANQQTGEICVICEKEKMAGIHLYTSFICTECERTMIQTDTQDPQYKFYIEKLRKVTNSRTVS